MGKIIGTPGTARVISHGTPMFKGGVFSDLGYVQNKGTLQPAVGLQSLVNYRLSYGMNHLAIMGYKPIIWDNHKSFYLEWDITNNMLYSPNELYT